MYGGNEKKEKKINIQAKFDQLDDGEDSEIDVKKLITIPETSKILIIWKPIEISCCIISCYYYAWIIAFGEKDDIGVPVASIIFEAIMAFSMCINFLREYTPDGETQPVKDLTKIAKHYLKNGF